MPPDDAAPRAGRSLLFVCTGNTCRSPLAEGLARRMLSERLGCAPADLPARGWVIRSAGIAASPGDAPSPEAIAAAAARGVDLAGHRSRPVNPELLAAATDVLAVSRGHAALLQSLFGVGPEPVVLGGPGGDLPDPVGGDEAEYGRCAEVIEGHLTRHLKEWLGS
jgi:protein-tyrosine-phosphatase